jgi:hypothetical protein
MQGQHLIDAARLFVVIVDCSDHGKLRIAHSCGTRVDDDSLPLAWRRSPEVMTDLVIFSLSEMVIEFIIGFGRQLCRV